MHTAREIHCSGGNTRSPVVGWGGGGARRWRSAVGGGICGAQRCRRILAPVTGSQCVVALWQGGRWGATAATLGAPS